jgi:hypothetical protein
VKSYVYEEKKKEKSRHTMDMDSIMAVSPATDVVEDNRDIIELPREDCGRWQVANVTASMSRDKR